MNDWANVSALVEVEPGHGVERNGQRDYEDQIFLAAVAVIEHAFHRGLAVDRLHFGRLREMLLRPASIKLYDGTLHG